MKSIVNTFVSLANIFTPGDVKQRRTNQVSGKFQTEKKILNDRHSQPFQSREKTARNKNVLI